LILALGVLVAVAAAYCMNYGIFLAKREVDRLPRLGMHSFWSSARAFVTSRAWLRSQGVQFLGGGLHVLAIGLAPLSVVAPIGAAGVVFLVILTVVRLGERADWIDWAGISVIAIGMVLLGVSLVRPTEPFSYRPAVSWFFIIFLFGVVAFTLFLAFSRKEGEGSTFAGIGLGVLIGLNAVLIKLAWHDVGLLYHTFGLSAFGRSSFMILAVLGSISAQVCFQMVLQRSKAMLVVPLVTGFSNMIPIMVGVLALKEPFPTDPLMISLRLLAFVFILGGAVLLSLEGVKDAERRKLPFHVFPGPRVRVPAALTRLPAPAPTRPLH
jgi:uncharacterized membrane protein